MENIKQNTIVFFDTDVIINWLCKEVDINTGEKLREAPYRIIKMIESKKIQGVSSLLNFMEIIFVLRRKKKWEDKEILDVLSKIGSIANFSIIIPDSEDIIQGYYNQAARSFDPFDSVYFGACSNRNIDFIITRDGDFMKNANIDGEIAIRPEEFLKKF
jgi:predicted nucleic acid-binding protein